ncbi:MAG TPA: class I SAM-dependent methyltransferase [Gemmataceae bacterium]|nr:class I SAM-dependent methyltransferase [Gemmataceae bacterium]
MSTTSTNYWPDARCAKAFWRQHELPPYQELLRDTAEWLTPGVGQRWLDLGCGSGQLSRVLWEKSRGQVEAIVGVDVAEINGEAFAKLRAELQPTPTGACLRFVPRDFTRGFSDWPSAQFDGVVSGLSLQYAESFSREEERWTEAAYENVLGEIHRLLKWGGRFVFSVNVPNPSWGTVAFQSVTGALQKQKPLRYLRNAWRMWSYGNWLTRESRRGRFHYLPLESIVAKLQKTGFADIEHRLSYARQAYLIRCRKP